MIAVPFGLLIALPTLRLQGLNLAVITLTAAAALDALVFNNDWFTGGFGGRSAGRLHLFGLDLSIAGANGGRYPRAAYGIVALVVVVLLSLLIARLRLSPLGRSLIAVRENERAADRLRGRGGAHFRCRGRRGPWSHRAA